MKETSVYFQNSQALYSTLKQSAPDVFKQTPATSWQTSSFKVPAKEPEALEVQNCKLPGISPLAQAVADRPSNARIPGNGQIPLSSLATWYKERKYSKKHTKGEWDQSVDYVKARSTDRMSESVAARDLSRKIRGDITNELNNQNKQVSDSFASRIATLRNFLRIERGLRQNLLDEIQGMTLAIEELEAWIASRTAWPIKVTERCCEFRNQRIGMDLVLDDLEVQLGKEYDMLTTVVKKNTDQVLADAYTLKADMEEVAELLLQDISRKDNATTIDNKMSTLKIVDVNKDADIAASVQVRPRSAIATTDWQEFTDALIERAEASSSSCGDLKLGMKNAAIESEKIIAVMSEQVSNLLNTKIELSHSQAQATKALLDKTQAEADELEAEIANVEELIENGEGPLLRATTRLETRRDRPQAEKTSDCAHDALIQEVSELHASINALESQLDIHMKNYEELKREEGTLEEELAIKKLTIVLEERCKKIRTFLDPTADNYTVVRMLNDDEFCDIMTR